MNLRALQMEMDHHFLPFTKTLWCCLMLSFLAFALQLLLLSQNAFAVNNNGSSSICLHHEKLALLQLKHGFSIYRGEYNNASSRLDSWNPDADCCSWKGITCDEAMGHVIGLDLSSNWPLDSSSSVIEGRINSSLFHLGSLQKLNFSGNYFYPNPIPSGFGLLTNLTHLDLSNSWFSGQIPLEISSLTKLISLDLSQDRFPGGLEIRNPSLTRLIQNLSNVRLLSLDGVTISEHGGKWAQALSIALPNLQKLTLRYCGLGGPIDPSLFQLPLLSQISLDGNNLSIVMPNFLGNSYILTSLSLSGCGLYGKFPGSIFLLPHLRRLDISNNPYLTIHLLEFPRGSSLQYLFLGSIGIHKKLLDSIGNLKFLKELSLYNCNLFGSLPSSIANLSHLESLVLSSNNLSGMIPVSFANELSHLTSLDLGNNSLEGPIPQSLFSHPSLQVLCLDYNQLDGCLPEFYNLSSLVLETILLSNNKLHGPIPTSIFELTELTKLDVSNNYFSGTIGLHMFQNMKKLRYLDLSDNNNLSFINGNYSSHLISSSQISTLYLSSCNISEFPNILQNLNYLQDLDLSNNIIHGEIPSWIWKVGNQTLYYLNLSKNFLESFEHPFPEFSSLSYLSSVDLHSNRLRGSLPVFPPQVYFQDYSNNNFSSVIPASINFTLSRFFFLSNNSVSGEIPSSICDACYLEILDLSNNKFSGKLPTCLGEIANYLEILNFRGNTFQGNVPDMFKKNCSLRTCNLNSNQLEGLIPRSLSNCKTLEVLDMGNNRLNDTFPFWLENLSNLRILILRSNTFHGPIVDSHTTSPLFPFLQIFDISSNSFMGVVPPRFFLNWRLMTGEDGSNLSSNNQQIVNHLVGGHYYQDSATVTMKGIELEVVKILIALTSVDLSNNKFHGEIPKSICNLKMLHVLNLSHNGFTGPIPTSLEDLAQLESLDLSRNMLLGSIPWQLTKLTFLAVLDLSENLLYGAIPQGQQFLTFTNSSFLGNIDLCGPPLTKKCVDTTAPPPTFYSSGFVGNGEIDWKFMWVGSGVGFGFGFGAVFWTLALWRKGSFKYFQLIDRMFAHMFFH